MNNCPTCNQRIAKHKVTFVKTMVGALIKAHRQAKCRKKDTVLIRELPLTNAEYARMNELVKFGFMYKNDDMQSGEYGLIFHRIEPFLRGEITVAKYYMRDPVRKTIELSEERIYLHQVPKVQQVIDELGVKMTKYYPNEL